jgi:hypothetical protein
MRLNEETGLKRCPHCGLDKPPSEFWRSKRYPDGLMIVCKPCAVATVRRWRQTGSVSLPAVAGSPQEPE